MHKGPFALVPELTLKELAAYQDDVAASLHLYFRPANPAFVMRFAGLSKDELASELQLRLLELDVRSTLAVLTSLEAYFRIDFDVRCRKRLKDPLFAHFRAIGRERGIRVRLDEDILEGWKRHTTAPAGLISQLRGAFKFRHWLAHGRYWSPKLGYKYDFAGVYLMAEMIISAFPFEG